MAHRRAGQGWPARPFPTLAGPRTRRSDRVCRPLSGPGADGRDCGPRTSGRTRLRRSPPTRRSARGRPRATSECHLPHRTPRPRAAWNRLTPARPRPPPASPGPRRVRGRMRRRGWATPERSGATAPLPGPSPLWYVGIRRVSTAVVQRFCKPKVGGSSPSPGTASRPSAIPSGRTTSGTTPRRTPPGQRRTRAPPPSLGCMDVPCSAGRTRRCRIPARPAAPPAAGAVGAPRRSRMADPERDLERSRGRRRDPPHALAFSRIGGDS